MTTFKQFLQDHLEEDISIDGNNLRITTQHYKAASTKESISTYLRTLPYVTHTKGMDADVYSMLSYVSSDMSSDILKSLKSGSPFGVNEKQLDALMKQVKDSVGVLIKKLKPDIIIYPKSSSKLLSRFVNDISSTYPSAKVLPEAFIKRALSAEDIEPLINTEHPAWKKFSEENPKSVHELKMSLKRQIKNGELELKKLFKPHLKFIRNFIELKDAYNILDEIIGKKVLVMDDILSSGSTMNEMIRQLRELEVAQISGLTLFKLTTTTK